MSSSVTLCNRPGLQQHHAPCPTALQAVAWLLSVPGASRTVLDMRVPYSRVSLKDVLGRDPETYASHGKLLCGCCVSPCRPGERASGLLRQFVGSFLCCCCCGGGGGGGGGGSTITNSACCLLRCSLAMQRRPRQWRQQPTSTQSNCPPWAQMWWASAAPAHWQQTGRSGESTRPTSAPTTARRNAGAVRA